MTSIKRFLLLFLCLVTKKTDGFFVCRSERMDHIGVTREACDSIANSVWQLATGCQCFSPKTFYFDGQRLGCMTRIDGCEVTFMKSTRKSDVFEGGSIESDDCEMKTTQISNNDGSWSKVEAEIDFEDDDTEIEFDDEDLRYNGKLIKATRPDECYTPCVVLKLQGSDVYNDNIINIKPTATLRTNYPPKTRNATTSNSIISCPPTPANIATTPGNIEKKSVHIIMAMPLGGFITIGVVIVLLLLVSVCLFINRRRCFGSKKQSPRERQPASSSGDFFPPPAEDPYHRGNNYTEVNETCFAAPAAQDTANELPPKYTLVDECAKNKPSHANTQQQGVSL